MEFLSESKVIFNVREISLKVYKLDETDDFIDLAKKYSSKERWGVPAFSSEKRHGHIYERKEMYILDRLEFAEIPPFCELLGFRLNQISKLKNPSAWEALQMLLVSLELDSKLAVRSVHDIHVEFGLCKNGKLTTKMMNEIIDLNSAYFGKRHSRSYLKSLAESYAEEGWFEFGEIY